MSYGKPRMAISRGYGEVVSCSFVVEGDEYVHSRGQELDIAAIQDGQK